jgi:hypothetical protein
MIIRFFKSNQQATFFAIPILILALWLEGYIKKLPLEIMHAMPVYKLFVWYYNENTDIIYRTLAIGLLIVQAIYLNNIINKHEVLYKRSHLPALIYCVLMSLFLPLLNLQPILIIGILLIRLLDNVLSFYKSSTNNLALDSGLIIGISSLIYFPSIILFLIVLIGLIILRPFYWRNWIVAIIGLTLPFYFISIYYLWNNKLGKFWIEEVRGYFVHLIKFDFIFSRSMKLLSITIISLLILSLLKLQTNFFRNVIRTRNYHIILVFWLIISMASLLLCPLINLESFSLMAIPASIFISYYFLAVKRTVWLEIIFLFLLFLIIYNQVVFKG